MTKEHPLLSSLCVDHHELFKQTRKNGYSDGSTPSPKRPRSNSATTMGLTESPDQGHVPGVWPPEEGSCQRNSSLPRSRHRAGETETTETVSGLCVALLVAVKFLLSSQTLPAIEEARSARINVSAWGHPSQWDGQAQSFLQALD